MRFPLSLLALTLSGSLCMAAPDKTAPTQTAPSPAPQVAPAGPEAPHDESVPHVHENAKAPAKETPIDYFWRKSDEAFHAGDYPRAIGLHRAIIALDPTEVESYSLGAWLSWSLGKADDAQKFISDGLKANPNDPEMWNAAGEQYDLQKLFNDSQNAYAKAVELSGKDADQMMRRRYAHALEHAGNLGKSAEVWRGLVADFPNETVNKNNLARVEQAAKDAAKGAGNTQLAALGMTGLLTAGTWIRRLVL